MLATSESLKSRLESAGLSLARAAAGGAIAVLTGTGAIANYNGDRGLGIALLIGAGAAVLRLLQTWIPALSFGAIFNRIGLGAFTAIADSYARAFLSALAVFAYGGLDTPNASFTRAAIQGAIVAAYTAALRVVQVPADKKA